MNHEIRIETTFNNDEIRQTMHGHGCVEDQIIQSVIKLKDEGVRKALIELGWTPPVEAPVPDFTGEGSAWVPKNLEAGRVVVPELTSKHLLELLQLGTDEPSFSPAANRINAWFREHSLAIPADRELMRLVDELIRWHGLRPLDKRPDHAAVLVGAIKALRANQGGSAT